MQIQNITMKTLDTLRTAFDWTPPDPVSEEIAERLLDTTYAYEYFDLFEKEVQLRLAIIDGLTRLQTGGRIGYNHQGDTLRLPAPYWTPIPAYTSNGAPALGVKDQEARPDTGAAFQSQGDPLQAVTILFTPGNTTSNNNADELYYLECNTATVAVHYYALGRILSPKAFSSLFPKGIVLLPEWLTYGTTRNTPAPSLELIPHTMQHVESMTNIIPGDWVYFTNFPDYEAKHDKNAPFTGENALYMGAGVYEGFGVPSKTFDAMNEFLIEQYNVGLASKDRKKAREQSSETLDGQVPGVLKQPIRRIMESQQVLLALEMN